MAAPPLESELKVMLSTERRIIRQLSVAYSQISKDLTRLQKSSGPTAQIQKSQLRELRSSIRNQMSSMWSKVGNEVRAGRIRAAAEAGDLSSDAAKLFKAAGLSAQDIEVLRESMREAASSTVDAAMRRMQGESYRTLSEKVYQTEVLVNGRLDDVINQTLLKGANAAKLSRAVREFIRPDTAGGVSYAARRLGRTEINNAFHATSVATFKKEPFVTGVEWNLSGSHKQPDDCNAYAEDVHYPGGKPGVYPPMETPPRPHPNCVIGSTLVEFPGGRPEAGTSRWHRGEVIEITTVRGSLTVTPNHPILTTEGWVGAGLLQEGQRVICCLPPESPDVTLGDPNVQQVEASAEDVFRSICSASRLGTSSVVRGMTEQFHGDGVVDQDVYVVPTDVLLQDRLVRPQPLRHHTVDLAHTELLLESSAGSSAEGLLGTGGASDGVVSSSGPGSVLLRGALSEDEIHRLLSRAEDSFISEEVVDPSRADRERELLGNVLRSQSGPVEVNDVLGIRRYKFSGHVYNFQTAGGFYVAQSIITHNCLCFTTAVTVSDEEFIKAFSEGKYDDWLREEGFDPGVRASSGFSGTSVVAPKRLSEIDYSSFKDATNEGLEAYKSYSFSGVNGHLRGTSTLNPEAQARVNRYINQIDELFEKTPNVLTEDIVVMRGESWTGKYNPADVYKPGEYVVNPSYTSSTLSQSTRDRFSREEWTIDVVVPKGTRVIRGEKDEHELLLPRNARFRVEHVRKSGEHSGHITLRMETTV